VTPIARRASAAVNLDDRRVLVVGLDPGNLGQDDAD
jgi:hypothetical protein